MRILSQAWLKKAHTSGSRLRHWNRLVSRRHSHSQHKGTRTHNTKALALATQKALALALTTQRHSYSQHKGTDSQSRTQAPVLSLPSHPYNNYQSISTTSGLVPRIYGNLVAQFAEFKTCTALRVHCLSRYENVCSGLVFSIWQTLALGCVMLGSVSQLQNTIFFKHEYVLSMCCTWTCHWHRHWFSIPGRDKHHIFGHDRLQKHAHNKRMMWHD